MRSSDRGFPRFLVLLALWALGAACASDPGSEYDPRPLRMVPSWGLNTSSVPVVIEGENFLSLVTQHIGGSELVSEDARFDAFLDEVALEDVALEDEHTLRARVPEGLAPGWHALSVRGPLGRRVELPRAYLSSDRPLAVLGARAVVESDHVWVGGRTRLVVTVENTGGSAALAVTPVLSLVGEGRVELGSRPEPADIGPGTSAFFVWELGAISSGELRFTVEVRGSEETTGMELPVLTVEEGPLQIRNRPELTAVLTSSAPVVNVGQRFELQLEVKNSGDTAVLDVTAVEMVSGCDGTVSLVEGPHPTLVTIPGRQSRFFSATLAGTGEGTCVFRAWARGREETEGTQLEAPVVATTVKVQRPSALSVTFSTPIRARPGSIFSVDLTVRNTGSTRALGVQLTSPRVSRGIVVPTSEPALTPVDLDGGASTTFTWNYRAIGLGRVFFSASASGTDGLSGSPVTSGEVSSREVLLFEVELVRADPLQDGSSFAQVFPYQGRLVLGPNRDGTRAVSVDPDTTEDGVLTFSFSKDVRGNASDNTAAAPYSSIGAVGCTSNTASCGPDNEDGRGFFFAGRVGTQEWLGIGGARSKGDLDYIYLTQDTGGPLGMRFLDLSALLGGQTRGFSSALFFHDRLYLGFPDTGGNRPYLLAIKSLPTSAPGLDAIAGIHVENLMAERMPGIGQSGSPSNKANMQMIDTLAAFNDRLYVVNNGGCIRSTTPTPRPYDSAPADWSACTPAIAAWSSRTSRTTTKTANLEPSDKAVPQLAVFQGRLYLARNTTVGPQLFACDPASTGSSTDCDPGDWSLVAPNSKGDSLLTQFDNPANTALSLLVATSRSLFVGFDNGTQGAVVLRTSSSRPAHRSDFMGTEGCSAAQHPIGCAGLGSSGVGVGATRIFDGVAFGPASDEAAFFTAGTSTGPVGLFRLQE
ncbi:hypothetical protein JRI60_30015 [Archangium violaceum]|uniref:hypothetical protein n=1 Tax=Archangium violaceum TaxID=83451 RepID=UPI0019506DB1|nr:hypothetical protein [Archangium violaceum]QRN93418.1 hypothetical protein JRI60_30015 [Archangium violaceum]